MSYWKCKVLPKIKKFFDKGKKKGASEVCKTFDKSKESLDKEIEEKTPDLNPKVVEIYRSSSTYISKKLLKEPNEATVKENPDAVQSVLQELVKAGFPGAQVICDAGTKFGPTLLPGPVLYLFEKASGYLVEEPLPEEPKEETREVTVEELVTSAPPAAATEADAPPAEGEAPPAAAVAAAEEEKKNVEEPKAEEENEVTAPDVADEKLEGGVAIASEPPPATPPPPPEKSD